MKKSLPALKTLVSKITTFKNLSALVVVLLLLSCGAWGQTTQTYSYTGANQTFTVPAGVTSINLKIWGAGGGGTYNAYSTGGSGSFVQGDLAVTPGQSIIIVVGGGGPGYNSTSYPTIYGGGGAGGTLNYTGCGGGYSGIFNTSISQVNALAIAGGGGGAGYGTTSMYTRNGGGGGATSGSNGGSYNITTYNGGLGASISSGGTGGVYNSVASGSNGSALLGGAGNLTTYGGGGGGGGYYGGGGGNGGTSTTYYGSGGGGGSSYLGNLTSVTNTLGTTNSTSSTATQAPGSAVTGYVAGTGNGGKGFGNTTTSNGKNGLIIITYTLPTCTAPTSLAATATSSTQTTTTISGSFTDALTAPSGYIVVRSTSAVAPTTLVLATALPTVGSTAFGTGTYVEYIGTAAGSWTSTSLASSTTYYYYVFSYNNTSCSGGPAYSSTATSLTQATVSCPGTSLAGLSYSSTPASYCLSSAITQNTATLATTAGNVTYSVSPALPAGLLISSSTGAITGTPTAAVVATNYTVTANNGCTSTTATVNIATLALPTAPVASVATSLALTSFNANWGTVLGATSYLLDVSTSSTFASFVSGFNGQNVANVLTYAVTGLSSGTTYYYRVRASNGSCTSNSSNTVTQVIPTVNGGALQETFPTANSGAVPTGWSTTGWSIGASATSGYPGNTANAIYKNLYGSATTGTFTTAIVGPLLSNANFTYDYALYDYNTTTATATGWGNFQVQISTDFGTTWSNFGAAVTANTPSGYVNISQSLSAYTGQYVQFKITATRTAGDYYLSFDNFNAIAPCPTPTAPTALVQGATGPGSITESFTPNATTPDGYMVVRYPTGSAVTAPTNGTTTYVANQALGLGTISNLVSGASASFTISGLTPNTAYDIYVYPYTSLSCIGAPVFGTALSSTQSTSVCPAIPTTISVGATGDYTSLSAVSLILNGCPISNPILVEIQSNYNPATETLPIVFNNNSGSSATNTVTIRPAVGAGAFALSSTSTSALLDLNGARYFTFDGRAGGIGATSALSITNTGNGAAVRLINDAQNNTIQYIALKASNTSATNGVVRIMGAAGTTLANGNNNNTITNNAINGNGVSPNGIFALGSASPADNKSNTISNNTIIDYYSDVASTNNYGILLAGGNSVSISSAWTISDNSFYQTASRTFASNAGIISAIGGGFTPSGAFNITGNFIGGTAASAGGTAQTLNGAAAYTFTPINVLLGGADASTISGNTIANYNVTTASTAAGNGLITVSTSLAGNTVSITNNTIGSSSTSGSIIFTGGTASTLSGITVGSYYGSQFATSYSITGNTIASIALPGTTNANNFRAINVGTAATVTVASVISGNTIGTAASPITNASPGVNTGIINSNPIGSSILNNVISYLTSSSTGTSAQLVGISTTSGINVIGGSGTNGNTIANFTSSAANTGTTTSASIIGITLTSTTAGQVVKNNKVSLLSNTGTAAASVNGIYFNGPTSGTNEVSGNLVHTLASSTAASTVNGIQIADSGNATIFNNIVRLGLDSTGADVTNNVILNGINQSSSTSNHNIYFNTVYIAGANVGAGANTTFAITSAATSGTRAIRNNIFSNLRANGTGTGKNYSIKVSGLTGLTINNNNYWTGSALSMLALNNATDATTLSAFQTATSQDGGSISVSPGFIAANSNVSTFDLHITGGVSSALESGGAVISGITTDYDGQTRPGPIGSINGGGIAPDMGADEFDGIPGYTCATLAGLTAATTNATVCNSSAVLSISGTISGTGITYQWQVASSQTGSYSNISGATASTYTVPTTSISNNWYQCIVTCLNGPISATATAVNVIVQGCNYSVSRNTNITYNSIMATGNTYTSLVSSGTTATGDDGYTNFVPLTGTTFKYRGQAVTQFFATSNGTMSFSATQNSHTGYGDLTTTTAGKDLMLAPYWTDFVIKGGLSTNRDASMRYKINGTLGSGTADIIIEWAEMEGYQFGNPNLNFQVVLHENGNTIEYNYGNMLKFDGAANFTGTFATVCAIGLNGTSPSTVDLSQRLILQNANSTNFGTTSVTNLLQTPACNSQLLFTPAVAYSGANAPMAVPTNNELAGAINLTVNSAPCTSNCGNSYYSLGATASSGTTVCSATTPGTADDDVWFTFTPSTSTANHKIVLTPTFAYDGVLQLIDVTSNTVVQCVNSASAGLSETISSVTLDQTHQYALRVYDAGTGAAGGGEFSICVSEIIPPPTNDDPSGATALTVGSSCSVTSSEYPATLAATATAGVTVCSATTAGTPDDDVWYKFTTSGTSGLTYTMTATGVSTYNAVLQLFSGTPGSLTSVDCVNATGNGTSETITSSSLTASTTYYLRVYHSGVGYATGNFNICLYVTPPACVTSPSAPTNSSIICLSAGGTTLSWASVSSATKYDVYLDNTGGTSSVAVSSNLTATSYTTPSALSVGTYTWRIVPKNDYGAATSCTNFTFTITSDKTWTGGSGNWNLASNWSCGILPTSTDVIKISSGNPILDTNFTIGTLGSLTISGTGTLTINPTKVLTTSGAVDFGGKSVTLKSDATGTGTIGQVTGTLIGASNVTVERYIPFGKRAYRLLTPSVTTTGFIYANWQIGGTTTAGRGTHITGSTTVANGFDVTTSGNPSMYTYQNNVATGTGWLAIPNTNATTLTAGSGYRTLVRGDRNVDISMASTDNMNVATTLSATGTLKVGNVVFDSSSTPALNNTISGTSNPTTNDFSLIGNPYASPVDWSLVTKNNVGDTYYTWDPNMGTAAQRGRYVAYDITTGRDIPESAVSQYIQPGQAFFVKTTAASPVLTFKEADKATYFTNVFRTNEMNSRLSISVYNPTEVAFATPIDGTTAVFGTDFNATIGVGDVEKLFTAGESLAWSRGTKILAIDALAPVVANDELHLKTMQFAANKSYTFKINATNFDNTLTAFLVDQYLNTQTQVDLTAPNFVTFATTTDTASYGADRFKVVFSPSSALNNAEWNSKSLRIYPNPVIDNQFTIAVSPSITDKVMITIYNMIGQSVYKESATAINNAILVRPSALLKAGVYMVEMINNGKTSTQKIIIK